MSEQACRGRPQIAVLMGFDPSSVFYGLPRCEDETFEGFPMIPGKKLHSTPEIGLGMECRYYSSIWEQKCPQTSP